LTCQGWRGVVHTVSSEMEAELGDEDFSADVPPSPSKTLFNDEEWEAMAKPRKTKKKGEDGEPVIAYDHYMLLGLEERYLATEKQIKDGACRGIAGLGASAQSQRR